MLETYLNKEIILKKIKEKKRNALFVDGGGARGIFGSAVIQEIGQKKYDEFNFLVGSSIGAILILIYEFVKFQDVHIKFQDVHKILIKSLKKIFQGNKFTKIFNFIFFGEFYREKKKRKIFKKVFGDKKIKDLNKEKIFFITTLDFVNGNPIIIDNVTGEWDEMYLWEVASYTSNAPFYFNDKNSPYVDGGLYANDPRNIYLALIKQKLVIEKINSFLSIGFMTNFKKMTKKDISQSWISKIPRMFDVLVNIEAQINDEWFNKLNKNNHLRVCLDLHREKINLDVIDNHLFNLVDESIKKTRSEIQEFVKKNL